MADHAVAHDVHHDDHHGDHHAPPFWRHYIFSTDHKMIGLQYGLSGLAS